jgi:hypothetical protein
VLAHATADDENKDKLRRLQSISDPVVPIAGIRAARISGNGWIGAGWTGRANRSLRRIWDGSRPG